MYHQGLKKGHHWTLLVLRMIQLVQGHSVHVQVPYTSEFQLKYRYTYILFFINLLDIIHGGFN